MHNSLRVLLSGDAAGRRSCELELITISTSKESYTPICSGYVMEHWAGNIVI